MLINMADYGDMLMSRTTGREDFLKTEAYLLQNLKDGEIILDFKDVKVLTPSWADEFITGLKNKNRFKITYLNTDNPSIKASLQTILEPIDIKKYEKQSLI